MQMRLYVLAFLVYFGANAIVTMSAGVTGLDAVVFPLANTLPPALLGSFVTRVYRASRVSAARSVAFGLGFAIASVAGTMLIAYVGLGPRFRVMVFTLIWSFIIAALIFVILAASSNVHRVQLELSRERERLAAAESARARAELAALRARIDPHFLFNTLHSLLALVHEDANRAEEAIEQFAEILRYTFGASDGSEERTLRQEWELVQNYLALERLRLGERLRVDERLEEDVAHVPLPVLTLQPLVENAIRHAIAPRPGGGRIEIHARRDGDQVRIDVSDDGPGAPPEALAAANGRGLQLVRERLERMYRGTAGMALGTSAKGFCVTIVVPVR